MENKPFVITTSTCYEPVVYSTVCSGPSLFKVVDAKGNKVFGNLYQSYFNPEPISTPVVESAKEVKITIWKSLS